MGDIGDRDGGHVNNVFNILEPPVLKKIAYIRHQFIFVSVFVGVFMYL